VIKSALVLLGRPLAPRSELTSASTESFAARL
jgi:hypothetical protein